MLFWWFSYFVTLTAVKSENSIIVIVSIDNLLK